MAGKLPAIQFYPADWRKDPGIQCLSFHDRGVWFEMICLMHESPRRGYLLAPNGKPIPIEALARVIGLDKQILGSTLSAILELGVSSVDPESGAIFNRRMVRDERIREIRSQCGKKGGNPVLVGNLVNQDASDLVKQTSKQKRPPSSSSSSSSSSSEGISAGAETNGGKTKKVRSEPTGAHAEVIAHFTAAWARRYQGKPYPFGAAAGRNGNAVKTILIACVGVIEDAKAAVDRFVADDDPFIHGHSLSMLSSQITKYMTDAPKGAANGADKPKQYNHAGMQEDIKLR